MKKSIIPFLSGLATGVITTIGGLIIAFTAINEREIKEQDDLLDATLKKVADLFDDPKLENLDIKSLRNKYIEKVLDAHLIYGNNDKNILININTILDTKEKFSEEYSIDTKCKIIIDDIDAYIKALNIIYDNIEIDNDDV